MCSLLTLPALRGFSYYLSISILRVILFFSIAHVAFAEPQVDGRTISWSNDGWYQVLNASNYTSVCAGESNCVVAEDGRYIVINHSTGERWENVIVGSGVNSSNPSMLPMPIVTGGTITWSTDGWYQVQNAVSYETLCEGGSSCTVTDSGIYIVINHHAGVRWTLSIDLDDEPADESQTPNVTDNIISWPDDGWYQVQDARDYSTKCEGGLFCEVPDGSYIVINHSTGMRFENIVVGEAETVKDVELVPLESVVEVNQLTINWPNNGWYEVQQLRNYETVCEGTSSCTVTPGTYVVINHTTNQRLENLVVEDPNAFVYEPEPCDESSNPYRLTLNCFYLKEGFSISYKEAGYTSRWVQLFGKSAGDINGDGYQDILVTLDTNNWYEDPPAAIVLLGSSEGFPRNVYINRMDQELAMPLDSMDYVTISGDINSAGNIGDINNDGFSDLGLVDGEGVKVILGHERIGGQRYSSEGDNAHFDGSIVFGNYNYNVSVDTAGDVNGDGIEDLLIAGDSFRTQDRDGNFAFGGLYLIYGRDEFPKEIEIEALTHRESRIYLQGNHSRLRFADRAVAIGDIDNDGFDDILASDKSTGETFLMYGHEAEGNYKIRLYDEITTNITRFVNSASNPDYVYKGRAVSGGGDFNGDGFVDIAIMEENTQEDVSVVFGGATRFPSEIDVFTLTENQGIKLSRDDTYNWNGVLDLKADLNGDGFSDLIVASPGTNENRGVVYSVFGNSNPRNITFGDISDKKGWLIENVIQRSLFGQYVYLLGDLNNDGYDDISIDFDSTDPGVPVYIIYGRDL